METEQELTAKIATELRVARERMQGIRLTNAQLAAATKVSAMAIGRYMNGERDIPTPTFVLMCRALGVSPSMIIEKALNN